MRDVNDDQLVANVLFSNRLYLYIIVFLVGVTAVMGVAIVGTLLYTKNKIESVEREYFATTHNGQLFELTPIDEPIGGEERALYFSSTCVTKMFQLDYVNYIRQMSDAQLRCFTDAGYKSYINAFDRAGLLNQLKDPKARLVLAATPGPGEFLDKSVKVFGGVARQTFTIRHPMELVFNGNVNNPRRGQIEVDLLRIDQKDRPDGLAVHAIRVKANKS
jgi:hypothetical protein